MPVLVVIVWTHQVGILVVDNLTAKAVSKLQGEVEAFVAQVCAEATLQVGKRTAHKLSAESGLGGIVFLPLVFSILFFVFQPIECHTCFGVDTGSLHHVVFVDAAAFDKTLFAVDQAVFFVFVRQTNDFVLEVRGIDIDIPREVGTIEDFGIQRKFHTRIAHVADIGRLTRESGAGRYGQIEEHISGLACEELYFTTDDIAEDSKLKADIEVVVRFPRYVLVAHILRGEREC